MTIKTENCRYKTK